MGERVGGPMRVIVGKKVYTIRGGHLKWHFNVLPLNNLEF